MNELIGTKIGEYEIVEHIGHGVAADVYKAYQAKLNRHVAVKVLSPTFVKEQAFLARFIREAQAVAQLDHPNILPVYGFDRQDDLVYIVMQYVDSGSLDDLTGQPLPLDFTLNILSQVGSALSYAHNRGIVHRDVKPGNILLGPDNWVLLTDFGLVKILETPADLTPSGMSLGTPAYMAPEQVAGDQVDHRADIYSLGATLYQMTTGRVPFEGGTGMAVAFKHVSEALVPPRKFNPSLPPTVDKVIVKALAKEPDLRHQTVDKLVAAFREAVEGTKAPAKHPTPMTLKSSSKQAPVQKAPSPPPASIPLEAIWPPLKESPVKGGKGWTLLATIAGALVGFFLILWAVAALLIGLL
ncbi:MAG: serine/threonine-protein kinase [Anaerolineae bacterium]|jgi:serine/threonine protein kinase